ncbi:T9SS type A sorting domain-containing protein [Flavobacteriaceae bacterium 144Ye]|nr:T9SS type A sorting domain-containing protein [Flavobacteriaceae bacterium 144Ye]
MKIKLLLILQFIILNSVYSQNGVLDPTFGNNGITVTDVSNNSVNDAGYSVLVKDNGAIIVTGYSTNTSGNKDFALVQYDPNGLIDNSFGTNGIVLLDINGFDDEAISSVLQSDGKIITVGYTNNADKDIIVARFNSNGSLDTSYATNGIYTYDSGTNDSAETLAISPDDKIIIGCEISNNYGVIKITNTGINDTTFGSNGIVTTNLGGVDYIGDIKLQSDGKILITGTSSKNSTGDGDIYDKTLIRYNTDGTLDTSFNSTGIIFTSYESGGNDGGYSIIIQTDGKIIVCGSSYIGANDDNFALTRYNNDGSIDSTFGNNGTTITDFGSSLDLCFSSVLQNDGKIILGGYIVNGTTFDFDFGLARYDSNGILDTSFGTNGITITDINNNSKDYGLSLAFHQDDKVLIAGNSRITGGTYDFTIARYNIDGNLGVDDFMNNPKGYLIYPNPTSESISIINRALNTDKVDIEIYSIEGKKIKTITDYNFNYIQNISLSNLTKGVYLVKILDNSTSESLKIIKK